MKIWQKLTWKAVKGAAGSAGGFLLDYAKPIMYGVVAIAALSLALWIHGAFKERDSLRQARKGTITQLTIKNERAAARAQMLQAEVDRLEAERDFLRQLSTDLSADLAGIRQDIAEEKAIFQNHDFTKLLQAKPDRILKLVDQATQRQFNELENLLNDSP